MCILIYSSTSGSDLPLLIFLFSPKRRFSDYMKIEDGQASEPKLILKRSPKEVSKLEQVSCLLILSCSESFDTVSTVHVHMVDKLDMCFVHVGV